jgi:hypothetical protein
MSVEFGPLFHWSPRAVRKSIDRLGLMPSRKPASVLLTNEDDDFRQPMVCLGTSPATAWAYSNGVWKLPGTWDLWEVRLRPDDEVHPLPLFGDRIVEVRVGNRIRKSRLVWVGERTVP